MTVQSPQILLVLLVSVPLLALVIWSFARGRLEIVQLATQWPEEEVARLYLVKSFFVALGHVGFVVFAILAAADITLGEVPVEEDRSGADVSFVIDLSRSMLAADVEPNRLQAGVRLVQSLARDLEASRFSVVGFKGRGVTIVPLTEDINAIDTIAPALAPELVVSPGTNLDAGIREGLRSLPASTFATRVIVLISDGEALQGDTDETVANLRSQGVPVFAVAVGTAAGAAVPATDGMPIVDENGRPVISQADPEALRLLAERTEGEYVPLAGAARELRDAIEALSRDRASEGFRLQPRRRYRLFLSIALMMLLTSLAVRVVRWRGMF